MANSRPRQSTRAGHRRRARQPIHARGRRRATSSRVSQQRRRSRHVPPARQARHPSKKHAKAERPRRGQYWSAKVTHTSDALDLERKVFAKARPENIARSLKRSAERSTRRKGSAYQSAMSMLTFYINRAGSNLSLRRRRVLEQSKQELRKAFGRE